MKDIADGKRIASGPIVPLAMLMAILTGTTAATGNAPAEQPPERQHDVLIPGTGVRLRESWQMLLDRKSTRLNSSHSGESRMPSSA